MSSGAGPNTIVFPSGLDTFTTKIDRLTVVSGESHMIPLIAPYQFYLDWAPLQQFPTTTSIAGYTEVSGTPGALQFQTVYSGTNSGLLTFNAANSGVAVNVTYTAYGDVVRSEAINSMQQALTNIETYIINGVPVSGDFVSTNGDTMSGTLTMQGVGVDIVMNGGNIYTTLSGTTDIGQSTVPLNAIYVDNLFVTSTSGSVYVVKTGDDMTGNLNMINNSSITIGVTSIASGISSFAQGNASVASGNYSHAINAGQAYGISSHAEGTGKAYGTRSHAEGRLAIASGDSAHAEGFSSSAYGDNSHAEGKNTLAYGNQGSHAEGLGTIAYGDTSHAEGSSTLASGISSHAEGDSTLAYGTNSHAEGTSTIASGVASHAEGDSTLALGDYSHAEGGITQALGSYSHAEGQNTIAAGDNSHSEGDSTFAFGNFSHVEGQNSIASGIASHAEGYSYAIADFSHAEGSTEAYGNYSHTEGNSTFTYGEQSHAEGGGSIAYGISSHAEGDSTFASGNNSHAEGNSTIAYGDNSHAEGNTTTTVGLASHAEGTLTVAFGSASHAEGSNTLASGISSHAEGQATLSYGNYSHAEGGGCVASGDTSHAEGGNTEALGNYSHAQGSSTKAYGEASHAQGNLSIASGTCSFAAGDRANAIGTTSFAFAGWSGTANVSGSWIFADADMTKETTNNTENSLLMRFGNGITLQSGTNLYVGTSGTQDVGSATNPLQAIYADNIVCTSGLGIYLAKTGGTMTGDIVLDGISTVSGSSVKFHSTAGPGTLSADVTISGGNATVVTTVYNPAATSVQSVGPGLYSLHTTASGGDSRLILNNGNVIVSGSSNIKTAGDIIPVYSGIDSLGSLNYPFSGAYIKNAYISNLYGMSPLTFNNDIVMASGNQIVFSGNAYDDQIIRMSPLRGANSNGTGFSGTGTLTNSDSPLYQAFSNSFIEDVSILTATATLTMVNSTVLMNHSTVAVLTLPSPDACGKKMTIIDISNNAATNNIIIQGSGGQLINGAGSVVISTNRAGMTLYFAPDNNWYKANSMA